MNAKKITIAIDGYSSCGKSTLAKALSKALNYIFIDTGAMYRAVTLYASRNQLVNNETIQTEQLIDTLPDIKLHFEINPETQLPEIYLNGENVAREIRSMEVSSLVSRISAIKEVREKLVEEQRRMGENGGVVMDGRDIGSVVFPNAELKLFVTASPEVRAQRRYLELLATEPSITIEEVKKNLEERDYIDSHRKESPLIQAPDAVVLDNTHMNQEEQLGFALALCEALQK